MSELSRAPIYMDLGDFIPESYTIRFVIGEREYLFNFAEAKVFEVLQLMANQLHHDDLIQQAHEIIIPFLKGHIASGDVGTLEDDLRCLPFRGESGSLDLESILDAINKRFKSKNPWGEQRQSEQPCVWFMRQIAFVMQASKGALSHEIIMNLSWRQFGVYLDSFSWLVREQTEKGRMQNAKDDLIAMAGNPQVKARKAQMVEETKEKVAKLKNRSGKKESVTRRIL